RRQLRADAGGQGGDARRRHHHRAHQRGGCAAREREPDVLPQHRRAAPPPGEGWRAALRLRRRDHSPVLRRARGRGAVRQAPGAGGRSGRGGVREGRASRRRGVATAGEYTPGRGVPMLEGLLVALYVFVLAMFVGFEVITKVPQILHTPLMSGSNAISGITIVGALIVAGRIESPLNTVIGVAAVALATINVVGGFMVTDRMLQMFKKRQDGAQ